MAAAIAPGGLRAAIEGQLEAMSPRDRFLLSGLVAFFSLVFAALLIWVVRGAVEDKASRLRSAKDDLEIIQATADQYDIAEQKIARAKERLGQFQNQPASAYFETVARTTGVIDSLTVNQLGSDVTDGMRQTNFRVELRRVPPQNAIGFVHQVETSGYPANVTVARFKASGAPGAKVIDLTLELVAYQMETP